MPSQITPGLLPFGEYRPDVADYEGQHSRFIKNVVPQGDGYGPVASLSAITAGLNAMCLGAFYALKTDGSVQIFAATSTKLWTLNATSGTWTDVSAGGGTYSPPPSGRNYQFVQFNNFVVAVQQNMAPQVYDLTSSTNFAALGGSPPQASFVAVVNRFLVLSGLQSPNVYRVQWSGLNAITTWDNVTNLSNFQDMADGGLVQGVVGGDIGYIFQDRSIRSMVFQPGSSLIFGIDRISLDDGLYAPYSLLTAAGRIFWISPTGFKMLVPGGAPTPIGRERVDRTFFANLDRGNLQLVLAAADPRANRVYWTFKSINGGVTGLFDTILGYDWALDRWFTWGLSGEFIGIVSQPGTTLEGVDAAYGDITVAATVLSSQAVIGSPDTWNVPNTFTAGQGINLLTTSALPSGYVIGTPYYIKSTSLTTSSFQLTASGGVGSLEGAAISSSSSGTGSWSLYVPSIENLNIASLDNIATSSLAQFAAFNSNHALGFFTGSNMEATMESAEHGDNARRIFVRGFRPITDAPGTFGTLLFRETQQTSPTTGNEQAVNATGLVPQLTSTRYARGKIRIPAGTVWNFASGVEPDMSIEGQR